MIVTREMVADHLKDYLQGACTLDQVVSWAEEVMAEGEIAERDFALVRDTVARLVLPGKSSLQVSAPAKCPRFPLGTTCQLFPPGSTRSE